MNAPPITRKTKEHCDTTSSIPVQQNLIEDELIAYEHLESTHDYDDT